MEEQQIQGINNPDKDIFASNEQIVHHGPNKILIDFKNVFPQFVSVKEPIMVINHRVILLDPYDAKNFLKALKDNLSKYEEKFGEIKKPKQLEQAEKEFAKTQKQAVTASELPSYMG